MMAVSIAVVAAISSLDLLAFVFAIGAEMRRNTVGAAHHCSLIPLSLPFPI